MRQIGHLYIQPDGLLKNNEGRNVVSHEHGPLERGQPYPTLCRTDRCCTRRRSPRKGTSYSARQPAAVASRTAPGGQSGVDLTCDNGSTRERIPAVDAVEEHFYDPDTGALKRRNITYENR